jgi:ASC-1-like (ASCH) protein
MLTITVGDRWITHILGGRKTIEGRLPKFGIEKLLPNDKLRIVCKENDKVAICTVINTIWYYSCEEYLSNHLTEALPGVETIQEGIQIYRAFISEKTEEKMGIVAIQIRVDCNQVN